jgi:hypothetical protein
MVMREKHNVTNRNVATIDLQLYKASTKATVVALVRSCGTTELRKAANLWRNYSVVKSNSSQTVFQ